MIRKIFLNFTIKDKIVASYQLNQPFDRFIKEAIIPSSRTGAMNIELLLPLANSIIENWKIGTFEQIMMVKNSGDCPQNYVF